MKSCSKVLLEDKLSILDNHSSHIFIDRIFNCSHSESFKTQKKRIIAFRETGTDTQIKQISI